MAMEMTREWLLERCKAQGLYRTPKLNDSLYLQSQAFCEIQNLGEYTGVKKVHLEENCLESLNGVQPLKQLQCLYLRKNFIRAIDHLQELTDLDTLDFSHNCLTKLDNLSNCLKLRVLVVSYNLLDSVASIAHLTMCPSIMILDLSHNKFKDGDGVLGVAKSLAKLTVLYLSGNPFVAVFPHYRKKLIGSLAKLNHLDDRPVLWDERRYAEAWMRGGPEEESRERDYVREMRATEETLQFEAMRRLRCQHMEERQYVASLPLLQFSPEELGEDVELLMSPPPDAMDQASIRKIEVQDGVTDTFEECGLRALASPAKLGENWTEGGDQALEQEGCSTLRGDCDCSMEHDSMMAQDRNQQGEAQALEHVGWSTSYSDMEYDYSTEHDSMLAQGQNKQCRAERWNEQGSTTHSQGGEGLQGPSQSTEGNQTRFCTTSPKREAKSMQHENIVQKGPKNWPAACPSTLQDLGTICLPFWKPQSQFMDKLSVEHAAERRNSYHKVEPSEDGNQPCEPTDEHGAPSPPPQQQESDSYEWNRYYNNPSFCGGQQNDDNFLLSSKAMNHTEPYCTQRTLSKNPSFCGQQIDDNFLLALHRLNHDEPNYTQGTLCTTPLSRTRMNMNMIQTPSVEEVDSK